MSTIDELEIENEMLRQQLATIKTALTESEVLGSYGMTKLSEKVWGNPEIQQFVNRRHSYGSYTFKIEGADMGIFIKEIIKVVISDIEKITHNAIIARIDCLNLDEVG